MLYPVLGPEFSWGRVEDNGGFGVSLWDGSAGAGQGPELDLSAWGCMALAELSGGVQRLQREGGRR